MEFFKVTMVTKYQEEIDHDILPVLAYYTLYHLSCFTTTTYNYFKMLQVINKYVIDKMDKPIANPEQQQPQVSFMPKSTIHPPGDKIQKAIKEFSLLLETEPDKKRWQLLEAIAAKYDLSPKECEFLTRHFKDS
ncbi:MAG: hypothetical protein ACWGOX_07355 [Desulforhopalus sp.]